MKLWTPAICLIFPTLAVSQDCSCDSSFMYLRSEVETNYAGFSDKVNQETRVSYLKYTDSFYTKVKAVKNEAYCTVLMYEWLEYFKDRHVQLGKGDIQQPDSIDFSSRYKNREVIAISDSLLRSLSNVDSSLPGIYYNQDSTYKIAVFEDHNDFRDFVGVVLESRNEKWSRGQVKMELQRTNDTNTYTAIVYNLYHNYSIPLVKFHGTSLGYNQWIKVGAKPRVIVEQSNDEEVVHFKQLNAKTTYLKIGSFNLSYQKLIDSIIINNAELLRRTENLIIDVRGNGGGGDIFYSLLPYLYTDPIVGIGNDIYATPDNIERRTEILNNPNLSDASKKRIEKNIEEMKSNIGGWVLQAYDDTLTFDSVYKYPQRIAILIDKHCASATEEFLLAARQSKKVSLLGQSTAGVLDYSNMLSANFPCKKFKIRYATTRSRRLDNGQGIDGIGIKPDILLSDNTDWIKESQKFLEK